MLRAVRNSVIALGAAGIIAVILKLQNDEKQTPPEAGGWRELSGPDFK